MTNNFLAKGESALNGARYLGLTLDNLLYKGEQM